MNPAAARVLALAAVAVLIAASVGVWLDHAIAAVSIGVQR